MPKRAWGNRQVVTSAAASALVLGELRERSPATLRGWPTPARLSSWLASAGLCGRKVCTLGVYLFCSQRGGSALCVGGSLGGGGGCVQFSSELPHRWSWYFLSCQCFCYGFVQVLFPWCTRCSRSLCPSCNQLCFCPQVCLFKASYSSPWVGLTLFLLYGQYFFHRDGRSCSASPSYSSPSSPALPLNLSFVFPG